MADRLGAALARRRLVVIGLDGATFDVLDPLVAAGRLPNLGRLMSEGMRTVLLSTQPPVTFPAWTAFLTGSEPRDHGVIDMLERRDYALVAAGGRQRRLPTFVAELGRRGHKVCCLGVPGTFPPEAVPGTWTVSGFDAPGARGPRRAAYYPEDLRARVEAAGGWSYATFNELRSGPKKASAALAGLLSDLDDKERVILDLFGAAAWDVFMVHLQASDTAGHHLWHTWDPSSPRHRPGPLEDALPRVYARLDALIGRLVAAAGPETRVLVVSDHGMGAADSLGVYLNRWLHERGLLRFADGGAARGLGPIVRALVPRLPRGSVGWALRHLPRGLVGPLLRLARRQPIHFAGSDAFSFELDYAPSIWLHRRSRFSAGRLSDSQADELRDRLATELAGWTHPAGGPLFSAIHRGEALFGPGLDAPDLVLEPAIVGGARPSFLPSPGAGPCVAPLEASALEGGSGAGMPGVHRKEGVFIAHGPGLPALELPALGIAEAGALIYGLLDEPMPASAHATPPLHLGAWIPSRRATSGAGEGRGASATVPAGDVSGPVLVSGPLADAEIHADPAAHADTTADADATVLERLRSLGYID